MREQDGKAVLCWKSIDAALYTIVTYATGKGEEKTIKFPTNEYETVIEDYASGRSFTWVTVDKPGETALDGFHSASNEETFPVIVN